MHIYKIVILIASALVLDYVYTYQSSQIQLLLPIHGFVNIYIL